MSVAPVNEIRSFFPALKREHHGKKVAYFDGPGGTQVPTQVGEAMLNYLYYHNANTHWAYPTSAETDAMIAEARHALADFIHASPEEIAFGPNMTTLTLHLARSLGRQWQANDRVVVTELDHHANIDTWRSLQEERGIIIDAVPFDTKTGQLDWDALVAALEQHPKLLAIGAASNALGTISDVSRACHLAHSQGALVFVDAVHYAPHQLVDVKAIDCDFLGCSSYKFYGPHLGILYGKADLLEEINFPKLIPAPSEGGEQVETGTQNHEGIMGAAAAVNFLADLDDSSAPRRTKLQNAFGALHQRGQEQIQKLWNGLAKIQGVQLFGPEPGNPRTPTLSFALKGLTSEQVTAALADHAVFTSHGDFYATTVVERLGFSGPGLVRAGCACYTTDEEIERLIKGVSILARS